MSTGTTIGVVIAVLVVVAVGVVLWRKASQRKHLRRQFGPEYDRVVERSGNRMEAERELAERERAHRSLELKPLTQGTRESYSRHWVQVQEQFVDAPSDAVASAHRLVTDLMSERGYPTNGDHEANASVLSVEHSRTIDSYRQAHAITRRQEQGEASTEDLRAAMVHYRTLFNDLLGDRGERKEGAR
ncbi:MULTISPECIES: hypothetical protein [Actinosynnema]|uniref:hypothetical protein n=1 Tax=Actinosynnema TaxID=40566 RepID=UPI0020A3A767|nr:hypothetical protein [Actinosynnema pretiosum]MCP2093251.1 hypothetical protein [Actinosynnema pretiosum]